MQTLGVLCRDPEVPKMKKRLQDTVDGCALLEYLVQNLDSKPSNFNQAFCDLHVAEFARRWRAAKMDDSCVGSLCPATIYRHVGPLFSRRSKVRVRDWSRVMLHARNSTCCSLRSIPSWRGCQRGGRCCGM